MNVAKWESTTDSPIIPGIARRSIAVAQFDGEMWRQRRIATQIAADTTGDTMKLSQYRKSVVSNIRGPR